MSSRAEINIREDKSLFEPQAGYRPNQCLPFSHQVISHHQAFRIPTHSGTHTILFCTTAASIPTIHTAFQNSDRS
ncbi:MAG: hypothetical protein KA247_08060, partial [Bacteroidetes bacterium]|nr:hypothetical protein [Bacteroidota bacterium]